MNSSFCYCLVSSDKYEFMFFAGTMVDLCRFLGIVRDTGYRWYKERKLIAGVYYIIKVYL